MRKIKEQEEENIIEVKEETQVGDIILEQGDRIRVIEARGIDTATKMKNFLMNELGIKVTPPLGDSNPYSGIQKFAGYFSKTKLKELYHTLEGMGWEQVDDIYKQDFIVTYESPDNEDLIVHINPEDFRVEVVGPKKAKTMTVSQYD